MCYMQGNAIHSLTAPLVFDLCDDLEVCSLPVSWWNCSDPSGKTSNSYSSLQPSSSETPASHWRGVLADWPGPKTCHQNHWTPQSCFKTILRIKQRGGCRFLERCPERKHHVYPEEIVELLPVRAPAGLCKPGGWGGGRAECLQLLSSHSGTRRREK